MREILSPPAVSFDVLRDYFYANELFLASTLVKDGGFSARQAETFLHGMATQLVALGSAEDDGFGSLVRSVDSSGFIARLDVDDLTTAAGLDPARGRKGLATIAPMVLAGLRAGVGEETWFFSVKKGGVQVARQIGTGAREMLKPVRAALASRSIPFLKTGAARRPSESAPAPGVSDQGSSASHAAIRSSSSTAY